MKISLLWLAACTVGLSLGVGGCAFDPDDEDDADAEPVAEQGAGLASCTLKPHLAFVENHYNGRGPSTLRAKAEEILEADSSCPKRFELRAAVWPTGHTERASRSIKIVDAKQNYLSYKPKAWVLQDHVDLTPYVCTSQSTPRLGNDFTASIFLYTTMNGRRVLVASKRNQRFIGFDCKRTAEYDGDPGG